MLLVRERVLAGVVEVEAEVDVGVAAAALVDAEVVRSSSLLPCSLEGGR